MVGNDLPDDVACMGVGKVLRSGKAAGSCYHLPKGLRYKLGHYGLFIKSLSLSLSFLHQYIDMSAVSIETDTYAHTSNTHRTMTTTDVPLEFRIP